MTPQNQQIHPDLKHLIEQGQDLLKESGCAKPLEIRKYRGLKQVCDCLSNQPGEDWQERWECIENHILQGDLQICGYKTNAYTFIDGINFFLSLYFVRSSYKFLFLKEKNIIPLDKQARNDYDSILKYAKEIDCTALEYNNIKFAYTLIRLRTKKSLSEFKIDDLIELDIAKKQYRLRGAPFTAMCRLLKIIGVKIDDAVVDAERHKVVIWTPEKLVAHYGAIGKWYEYPLLMYLNERAAKSNPTSVTQAARHIIELYWNKIISLNPAQKDFRISYSTSQKWKLWATALESGKQRDSIKHLLTNVRSFYNWIEMMVNEDPVKWKKYGAHNPITAADINYVSKELRKRKGTRKNQTANILPHISSFRKELWKNYVLKNSIVVWARSAPIGEEAEFDGHIYKVKNNFSSKNKRRYDFKLPKLAIFEVNQPSHLIRPTVGEDIAFWMWVVIEILITTGLRPGELLSLQVSDIVLRRNEQGDAIPCLQIKASKTSKPRIVSMTPNTLLIVDIIMTRVKAHGRQYSSVIRRNLSKREYGPKLKFLIQRRVGLLNLSVSTTLLGIWVNKFVKEMKRKDKLPGYFKIVPSELRRVFATMLYRSGISLITISRLLGHSSLEMTRNYIADGEGDDIDPGLLGEIFK